MAGSALVGGMVFARELYHYFIPRKVGVYGPPMTGKTTLDRYMTTPGEMEEIPESERTKHEYNSLNISIDHIINPKIPKSFITTYI